MIKVTDMQHDQSYWWRDLQHDSHVWTYINWFLNNSEVCNP